ncbi:MAG: Rab proteins geranylgeranyltransferase component A [Piccolia ochrophora]|nr:MAG: Rab proteins geranylgeranyltransferase component A [Piccolia ochrophora]
MESLAETTWDVLISGTGLQQSLLALALSRSGKKILHVDKNDFYGGPDAAFSLQEAEKWMSRVNADFPGGDFRDVSFARIPTSSTSGDGTSSALSFSRAYTLSLSPHIIYSRSALLPYLVSSKVYKQLEFQAVGSWWLYSSSSVGSPKPDTENDGSGNPEGASVRPPTGALRKVPNGREDIFSDDTLSLKSKRFLMKFLKFVGDYENQREIWEKDASRPFDDFLSRVFDMPKGLCEPLYAITMSGDAPSETATEFALPRIATHLRSIGVFGPGFGAVIPKWGGLSEIAQVGCRAGAVGGGVYMLDQGISAMDPVDPVGEAEGVELLEAQLHNGEQIRTRWIVGSILDLPGRATIPPSPSTSSIATLRSISIVSSPLNELFPPLAEGAPLPAGAVVVLPSSCLSDDHAESSSPQLPPVYIIVHSSETGECPAGQCILYASTLLTPLTPSPTTILTTAIDRLLSSLTETPAPQVLYTLQYTQTAPPTNIDSSTTHARILTLPPVSPSLVFSDTLLDDVKSAWRRIMLDLDGEDAVSEESFLVFEERGGDHDDDDDGDEGEGEGEAEGEFEEEGS